MGIDESLMRIDLRNSFSIEESYENRKKVATDPFVGVFRYATRTAKPCPKLYGICPSKVCQDLGISSDGNLELWMQSDGGGSAAL